eukprot:gb/GFBE01043849.1/.p1 GENE.gb/GFBE01043849.1/~~gb/GFBE01043849.1/.p1  ORF type:complete len:183 (+),score=20.33 gb/GFBE01043849.1/:1-549(+)
MSKSLRARLQDACASTGLRFSKMVQRKRSEGDEADKHNVQTPSQKKTSLEEDAAWARSMAAKSGETPLGNPDELAQVVPAPETRLPNEVAPAPKACLPNEVWLLQETRLPDEVPVPKTQAQASSQGFGVRRTRKVAPTPEEMEHGLEEWQAYQQADPACQQRIRRRLGLPPYPGWMALGLDD